MIVYSNTSLHAPHLAFIGRWSPFHKGHEAIILKTIQKYQNLPILIMVRDTNTDQYSPATRAHYIKLWMQKKHIQGTIIIIPNVAGIFWGRGVGYQTEYVDVDKKLHAISATAIRKAIRAGRSQWKQMTAMNHGAYLLSPRIATIQQQGLVVWLTGYPSSGKTTIASGLLKQISKMFPHLKTQLLDGDDMRASPLADEAGFTREERIKHIRKMAYLAKMFADHGLLVVCAFVSPDALSRLQAKRLIGKHRFCEVYVHASKKTRIARDTKGMYAKAMKGEIKNFTGISARYERPLTPDIRCDTSRKSVESCVNIILAHITK